jgi:polyhydroxyalkanoate synthase
MIVATSGRSQRSGTRQPDGGTAKTKRDSAARDGARDAGSSAPANDRPDGGERAARSGERGPLDAIVNDIAFGSGQRQIPGLAGAKLGAKLALRPQTLVKAGGELGGELVRIVLGRSEASPDKGDRRFKDPAWESSPAFRRLAQAYVATGHTVDEMISAAKLDWRSERRARFAAQNVLDALAPTNFPLTNPSVLKAIIDSCGLNLVQGARHLVNDMRSRPFLPSSIDETQFEVGEDLAVTPGAIVMRTEMFELIQYNPSTEKVREVPLLVVPQMINKYYIVDLAPGRSLMEHAVGQGQQVFMMSWRNPDERHADWNFDAYCRSALEALEAVERITGSERTHVMGLCAGGNIAALVLGHLAASERQDRVASLTLGVTVLDWSKAGMAGAFLDRTTAAAAMAESARRGYLDGRTLAGVFSWLRPNDMVWGYVVNNYLLGKRPPPFDVLYWNNDQIHLPAALHRDFIQHGLENSLARPGELTVLDTPIDLSKVTVDSYVVAGIADHISPWPNVYQTTQLLGSAPRFVLSTSGHVVALVNPPGNEKASFKTNDAQPKDSDEWLDGATTHAGSWWPDWTAWLGERSGAEKAAPKEPGGDDFPVLGQAPGSYVRQKS